MLETRPTPFPRREVATVAALILVHLAIVAWMDLVPGRAFAVVQWGALRKGMTAVEPWRLVTSMFLHADYPHVLWNGLSTMIFAVPLLGILGYRRGALVYLAAGVGGGMTAVAFAGFSARTIGSSGAVAGLFGAWLVLTLQRARLAALPGRTRIRSAGIALLVLPSLIQPLTGSGMPISVGSHLGGAATGMIVGALLSKYWLPPLEPPEPEEPDDETDPQWLM